MYTCGFRLNANLVKEGDSRINAKLVKEELNAKLLVYYLIPVYFRGGKKHMPQILAG